LPSIIHLGLNPFLAAAQTGGQNTLSVLFPFLLTLTDEPFLTFVAVLGLIGFFVCLKNKNLLIPLWYFIPYLVDPRSAATYSMIPLSLMAGIALGEVILPVIARFENTNITDSHDNPFQSHIALAFLIVAGFYMLGGTLYFGSQLKGSTLPPADRTAFNWIKANTPSDSRILIMTGESQLLCDSLQEWFPILTDRESVTTIQGNEWLPNHKYVQSVALQNGVQSCVDSSSPLSCIEKYNLQYEYIYVSKQGWVKNSCRAVMQISRGQDLIDSLEENNKYQLAYQSNAVTIYSILH
jgi:hypothetical protein